MNAKNESINLFRLTTPILLIMIMALSACQPQGQPAATQETPPINPQQTETAISPTATLTPQVTFLINGSPFMFNHSPQIIDGVLWLPAQELFTLLERTEISVEADFLSTIGNNLDQKTTNCHFWIGHTGQNVYSSDTENEIWFESDSAVFVENNDVYLSEKMVEDCVGEFIQFNQSEKNAYLSIPARKFSSNQTNNTNPFSIITLKKPADLENTRVNSMISGLITMPVSNWLDWLDRLKEDGFTGTRSTLSVFDGPAVDERLGTIEETIPADYVAIYQKLQDLGITTRYGLTFWDLAYQKQGGNISYERLNNPEEVDRYLDYVRMVVTTLKGLVDEYELWNEPDANRDWYQRVDPEDYIAVAKLAIPIIREIDPEAKIVLISSSSYIDLSCQEYTNIILESDILSMADAISLHTVNNDASPEFRSEYYYGYDEMWKAIKTKAEANGFSGEYYADELNYRSTYSLGTLQPEMGDYHPYSPEVAAKYIGRMIAVNLGMDISVGTSGTNIVDRPAEGGMIRNMAYLMEGLKAAPLSVEANSTSEFIRYYTFENADGDQYIVIWNDVEAKVDSEDIEVSLVIDNGPADSITAINPYLLISQRLNFENTSDRVVIDQLLIKDYPIIIKINLQ